MKLIFNNFNIHYENISFLETKKNIIMEGIFTKIIYSDMSVTINGMYIFVPFLFNLSVIPPLFKNHENEKSGIINNRGVFKNTDLHSPTIQGGGGGGSSENTYNNYYYFYSYTPHNLFLIKKITELEKKIIEYYKSFYGIHKKCLFNLSNLIQSGRIKLYKDDEPYFNGKQQVTAIHSQKKTKVVLKISGVWETSTDIGLTYKFVEMYEYVSSPIVRDNYLAADNSPSFLETPINNTIHSMGLTGEMASNEIKNWSKLLHYTVQK